MVVPASVVKRLIPAGAGSTQIHGWIRGACPAHPRWRGEHFNKGLQRGDKLGSSPLARGARLMNRADRRPARLIPAGAGSTRGLEMIAAKYEAHPRWRGEHAEGAVGAFCGAGSSPLARGARGVRAGGGGRGGLIPAGAGSTVWRRWHCCGHGAHPRWRGEHARLGSCSTVSRGSSPLARGAPSSRSQEKAAEGLIPAGAGSTTGVIPTIR